MLLKIKRTINKNWDSVKLIIALIIKILFWVYIVNYLGRVSSTLEDVFAVVLLIVYLIVCMYYYINE